MTELAERGFTRLDGPVAFDLLGAAAQAGWAEFAASWNDLGKDRYMADGGRYRRRRHAVFAWEGGALIRKPHQPHYQSRDYNPLNGDVQRWFEPVLPAIADHPVMRAVVNLCMAAFAKAEGGEAASGRPWHIEMHQFRIETTPDHVGRPTPEGMHRDGVDWVFVMLVRRENVREGVTEIGSPGGESLGRFLLKAPGDAVLLDDRRILHGVTEVHTRHPPHPASRDVLVVTFARE